MDAGIIAAVKRRYRKRQISRALHVLNPDSSDIYKIDQTTAMRWIAEAWDESDADIV